MEKKVFCSSMMPSSLLNNPEERCENCTEYYRAADVDALLAGVRRLVEVLDHPYLEDSPEATNCPICKAIAAVERLIGGSDDTR